MELTDLMSSLEKAVANAQAKEKVLNTANQAVEKASKDYSEAVQSVDKLKEELNTRLGGLFTQNSRVRQA